MSHHVVDLSGVTAGPAALMGQLDATRLPFRVGVKSPPGQPTRWLDFQPAGTDQWLDASTGLKAVMTHTQKGVTRINSLTLTNTRDTPSPAVDIIEPLALCFKGDSFVWNHTRLWGGTSEHACPPQAYRPQTLWDMDRYWILESHPFGRSSNQHLPLLISVQPELDAGLFCGLEWSGQWYIHVARAGDEMLHIVAGIKIDQLSLDPGETIQLPASHLGFFQGQLPQGTNALRKHLCDHVLPDYNGRRCLPRVTYDHWFGVENDFDASFLKQQVDVAAELGVEVFAHDAAWFQGGFPDGVGNWQHVDKAKHPQGLEHLADYVRSKGMDFGLWFEIERAAPGTQAVLEHPEMFIHGDAPSAGGIPGEQYHLNLARVDAQDWTIHTLDHWIRKLDLRWSRWDYNIEPGPFLSAQDPTGKLQFHYMRGLYRVLDTLIKRHPQWMIEMCASGGRRIDLGILRRSHTLWFSDQTKLPSLCRLMQASANLMLPGRLLNSSVAIPKASCKDNKPVELTDTHILSRMLGKLAFDGDIARLSPNSRLKAAYWINVFKAHRHLFDADYHLLAPLPSHPDMPLAAAFVSPASQQAIVLAFAGQHGESSPLKLPFAKASQTYEIRQYAMNPDAVSSQRVTGQQLLDGGMPVHLQAGDAAFWSIAPAEK